MELCVFQGTFNPIHNAHLRVAEYVTNNLGIDKIMFIPAYIPPHKECVSSMSLDRLNMVRLAVESYDKFKVSDIEFKLGGKSYTYLTICELYKKFDITDKIKFIIGTDAFKKIETWYETDKLKTKLYFLVFPRENDVDFDNLEELRTKGYEFDYIPLEFKDVSSTQIRDCIHNGRGLENLVPKKVEEYIRKNGLYKD